MADEPTSDQGPSPEAFNRIKTERDQLKEQVDDLSRTVKDLGYRDKARQFYKDQGVSDPDWAAEMVLPHVRDVPLEELSTKLAEDRFARFGQLGQQSQPPAEGQPDPMDGVQTPTQQRPPSDAAPPRVATRPNPGAQGGTPEPEKVKANSPEFKELRRTRGDAYLRDLDAQGRIDWTPSTASMPIPGGGNR